MADKPPIASFRLSSCSERGAQFGAVAGSPSQRITEGIPHSRISVRASSTAPRLPVGCLATSASVGAVKAASARDSRAVGAGPTTLAPLSISFPKISEE